MEKIKIMKNKRTYLYIIPYLALFIPTPGRFVYGIVLCFEIFILNLVGIFINALVDKLELQNLKTPILIISMIAISILYRNIFIILQTELALTLGYIFYLPPISLFTINFLFSKQEESIKERLEYTLPRIAIFCGLGLLLFLFRDIAGFGTFTFFGSNHSIYERIIFNPQTLGIFSFFASIPGVLILDGLILFLYTVITHKIKILENAEGEE